MALTINPKLCLIPSGYKASKVYSVLPTDGTGDFTFSRAGALPSYNATRVNSEGLIEEVLSNVPRLNYPMIDGVVSGCPSLLLEPQRTNLIPYSEDFSNAAWIKGSSTVNENQVISPDGTLNADLIVTSAAGGGVSDGIGGSGDYSFSVFAKYKDIQFIRLRSTSSYAWFDIENGSVGTTISALDAKIEYYGNGWYRCTLVGNNSNTIVQVTCTEQNGANVGFGSVYLWGAQFEAGSYATSYIPTQGSAVTRVADVCSQTPPSGIIGQTDGTLFVEFPNINNTFAFIGLTAGSNNNRMVIYSSGDNILTAQFRQLGTIKLQGSSNFISGVVKASLSFSSTESIFYVNGIQIAVGTASAWESLNEITLNQANQIGARVSQIKYYNERLTNAELQALTTL